jgi:hypothetical protein
MSSQTNQTDRVSLAFSDDPNGAPDALAPGLVVAIRFVLEARPERVGCILQAAWPRGGGTHRTEPRSESCFRPTSVRNVRSTTNMLCMVPPREVTGFARW